MLTNGKLAKLIMGLCACALAITGCGSDPLLDAISDRSSPDKMNTRTSQDSGDASGTGKGRSGNTGLTSFLSWHWTCPSFPEALQKRSIDISRGEIQDSGPHNVSFSGDALELEITGEFCRIENDTPRNIVLMIDVSTAMMDTDPVSSGTCGRLNALDTALFNLSAHPQVQVALVTFNSIVRTNSQVFMPAAQMRSQFMYANTICRSTILEPTTNYATALDAASNLFAKTSRQASNEVYLLSAGAMTNMQTTQSAASALQNSRVMLATLMMGTQANTVGPVIASIDAMSKPLHYVAGSSGALIDTFQTLVAPAVSGGGGVLAYRPLEGGDWKSIAMKAEDGYDFHLLIPNVNMHEYVNGFEFKYSYGDNRSFTYGDSGSLVWKH